MSQIHKHTIPANIADRCLINPQQYEAMYQQSIDAPDTFWGEQGKIPYDFGGIDRQSLQYRFYFFRIEMKFSFRGRYDYDAE